MSGLVRIPAIKPPVTFNPFKHHLAFLKKEIVTWRTLPWDEVEQELLQMGSNLIDLYCGKLTVEEICIQCLEFAKSENINNSQQLAQWLYPKEFRKTVFADQSVWVVKQGLDNERFLHIHPAKYSPFTIRVRATTLKTVVALLILNKPEKLLELQLQTVNQVRKEKLGLSPVKSVEKGKGIDKIWSVFNSP